MSEPDPELDEILRHAISQALDLWNKRELEKTVWVIRKELERAGYAIRRSEQEPYRLMPVFKASER